MPDGRKDLKQVSARHPWEPDNHDADRQSRDALAARGYWQAFQLVRETVRKVIAGGNPGALVRTAHRDWYGELFQPCVAAGLIAASILAGYRNHAVFLRASRHVPPRWKAVRTAMPALFEWLESESEPSVQAVLGHWLFGYVHPYPDGNGRLARFVMKCDARLRRPSLDGGPRRAPRHLSCRPSERERRSGHRTFRAVCRGGGRVVIAGSLNSCQRAKGLTPKH